MLVLDARQRRGARGQRRAVPQRRHRPRAALHRRAAAPRLGPPGSRRLGQGARGRHPGGGGRRRRRPPARSSGLGIDFTSCTVLPVTEDGTPLCTLDAVSRAPPRLAQAVEAPRRPAGGRPSQRGGAGARRALPGALRRADLVGVVLPQAHRGVVRGPRGLRRLRGVHRGHRLDRLASDRHRGAPERHRRLQGDVVTGRRAAADGVFRGGLPRASRRPPRSSAPSSCRWAPRRARSPPSAPRRWA